MSIKQKQCLLIFSKEPWWNRRDYRFRGDGNVEGSTLYESVLNGDKVTILGSGDKQRDYFLKQNVFESNYKYKCWETAC